MDDNSHVQVYIRIRPTASFADKNLSLHDDRKSITVHCKKDEQRGYINNQVLDWKFSFDGILHNVSQEETFKKCASSLVTKTLDGYNSTIFAYGETGAGKTFTMTGTNDFRHRGLIPRALTQLYAEIKERYEHDITISISYMQIYKDKIYDLLRSVTNRLNAPTDSLTVTEESDGTAYVKGLSCHPATTEEEALNLLFEGETNRIISHHQLNRYSSRSHCIFTISVHSRSKTISNTSYTLSKLNLVDLAGSERIGKTLSEGKTQEEALYINKSLTFLEQAIIALADPKRDHVPYRQSKLTHVLKNSIGGRCQTVMIGNVWGDANQLEETLSTLRFGNRVMCVMNEPAVNAVFDPIKICSSLEKEISLLRKELSMYDTLTNRKQVTYEPLSEAQIQELRSQVRKFIDDEIQELDIMNVRQLRETFEQFKIFVKKAEESKVEIQEKKEILVPEKTDTPSKGSRGKTEVPPSNPADEITLVGETDGQNFGVGIAPNSAKMHQPSAIVYSKKTRTRKVKPDSGGDVKRSPSPSENVKSTAQQNEEFQTKTWTPGQVGSANQSSMTPIRPRTPPPKPEAFEQFKKERGEKLNQVLTENKDILKMKKLEAKDTVIEINAFKTQLDVCKEKLEKKQITEYGDEMVDGERIIDESEYILIKSISDIKAKYREKYDQLQNLRSDICYCENIVQQCRQRLLIEFNAWYAECFMPIDDKQEKTEQNKADDSEKETKTVRIVEDEQEKFDRLQMELLMEHPESVPFYNAKLQTERRQLYTDGDKKRKPGGVFQQIKNKPPTSLTVN